MHTGETIQLRVGSRKMRSSRSPSAVLPLHFHRLFPSVLSLNLQCVPQGGSGSLALYNAIEWNGDPKAPRYGWRQGFRCRYQGEYTQRQLERGWGKKGRGEKAKRRDQKLEAEDQKKQEWAKRTRKEVKRERTLREHDQNGRFLEESEGGGREEKPLC